MHHILCRPTHYGIVCMPLYVHRKVHRFEWIEYLKFSGHNNCLESTLVYVKCKQIRVKCVYPGYYYDVEQVIRYQTYSTEINIMYTLCWASLMCIRQHMCIVTAYIDRQTDRAIESNKVRNGWIDGRTDGRMEGWIDVGTKRRRDE